MMPSFGRIRVLVLSLACLAPGRLRAEFVTIDVPGAQQTIATRVEENTVVGYFQDAAFGTRGFSLNGGSFQFFDAPGAQGTLVFDINFGRLVGTAEFGQSRSGFIFDGVSYTFLNVAGSIATDARGIDGNTVVGVYQDAADQRHGFIYDGSSYTTLDVPGAIETFLLGIRDGKIVGTYTDANAFRHGFLYDGVQFTTIDVPGSLSTFVRGIDGGTLVGEFQAADGTRHGFLYDGSYVVVEPPGSIESAVYGIDGGTLVGRFEDAAGVHGFITGVPEPAGFVLALTSAAALGAGGWKCRRRR